MLKLVHLIHDVSHTAGVYI